MIGKYENKFMNYSELQNENEKLKMELRVKKNSSDNI